MIRNHCCLLWYVLVDRLFALYINVKIVFAVGGSEEIRVYWSNFVQDTDLLIYVVDSTDEHRLSGSVKELRILTACDKLRKVPIVILANKQVDNYVIYNMIKMITHLRNNFF